MIFEFLKWEVRNVKRKLESLKSRYQEIKSLISHFTPRTSKILNKHHKISILLLLVTSYLVLVTPSFAQESTESSSITDKINALKSEIASKAAELKTQITKKVQNKAILGTILNISSNEITIDTLNGPKIVKYDEFTEARGLKNKEIKIDALESGDKIAALGDVDDKGTLITQRLIFLENFASNSAQLAWGQIQKSTDNSITLKTKDNQTENILTNSQTIFFLGNNEASIADAKVEKHLVARGTRLKDGSLRARFIYLIPSTGFTKPSEPSAPKPASSSAKPKN